MTTSVREVNRLKILANAAIGIAGGPYAAKSKKGREIGDT
jgi:hypothetical protein